MAETETSDDVVVDEVLDEHYQTLAEEYDEFLHYSPDFVRTLTAKMVEKLELQEDDLLVDIGCGTGMYPLDILEQVPLEQPVLGVDPYAEMLEQIPDGAHIRPIVEEGLAFTRRDETWDKVLIKETVHHIKDREELFRNLYQRLRPGGIVLLVHVPPDVDYPLFDAALERALTWHADPDELVRLLGEAGFAVDREELVYEHTIPKDHYFRMVETGYMSVLTSFEEDELQAGLQEMRERYADIDVLRFPDRFDYVTGRKPA